MGALQNIHLQSGAYHCNREPRLLARLCVSDGYDSTTHEQMVLSIAGVWLHISVDIGGYETVHAEIGKYESDGRRHRRGRGKNVVP